MTDNERRQHQRINFIADVLLSNQAQQWSCRVEDISLKGMLIIAPEGAELVSGETYNIELVLGEGATIGMQAIIHHAVDGKSGFKWENINLESLTHLRRLLELNMENPQEMHRELAELG